MLKFFSIFYFIKQWITQSMQSTHLVILPTTWNKQERESEKKHLKLTRKQQDKVKQYFV